MRIADPSSQPTSRETPAVRPITRADRARASGPGLRAFRNIADLWRLSERERIAVLGEPGRSTYHQWMKKAQEGAALVLPLDTLLRISAVLGIHKALTILFEDEGQALAWMTSPHRGTVFRGAAPMAFVVDGAHDGLMSVRRYLDAWRGGAMGHGVAEGGFAPVGEGDLIFA